MATSGVYILVIEDVINKIRDEFVSNGGPGDAVLLELPRLWEAKMMQAGSILGPIERSAAPRLAPGGPITPVHDLNVPYEGTEEYETPTADMLFPLTPMQTPMQTPLPGSGQTPLPGTVQTPGTAELYNIPTDGTPFTPGEYPSESGGGVSEIKPGRPSQFMQPPAPWLNQRPPLDVNVAYDEGHEEVDRGASLEPTTQDFFTMSAGKRKRGDFPSQYNNGYIPQQDGAGDAVSDESKEGTAVNLEFGRGVRLSSRITQADGPTPDPYDDALSTPNPSQSLLNNIVTKCEELKICFAELKAEQMNFLEKLKGEFERASNSLLSKVDRKRRSEDADEGRINKIRRISYEVPLALDPSDPATSESKVAVLDKMISVSCQMTTTCLYAKHLVELSTKPEVSRRRDEMCDEMCLSKYLPAKIPICAKKRRSCHITTPRYSCPSAPPVL